MNPSLVSLVLMKNTVVLMSNAVTFYRQRTTNILPLCRQYTPFTLE